MNKVKTPYQLSRLLIIATVMSVALIAIIGTAMPAIGASVPVPVEPKPHSPRGNEGISAGSVLTTPLPTKTPIPATETPTVTATATLTPTATVAPTITPTVTMTPTVVTATITPTVTMTPTVVTATATPIPSPTPPPVLYFSASTMVDKDEQKAGGSLEYTIVITRLEGSQGGITIVDTLPDSVVLDPSSLDEIGNFEGGVTTLITYTENTVTWSGRMVEGAVFMLSYKVDVKETAALGDIINHSTAIDLSTPTETLQQEVNAVETTIVEFACPCPIYMPILYIPLPEPTDLVTSRPTNTGNGVDFTWTLMWNGQTRLGITYELEESHSESFSNVDRSYQVSGTTQQVTHARGIDNMFYYRVRAKTDDFTSEWSNVVKVVSAYHDDFTNDNSGWQLIRQDLDDTNNKGYYKENHWVMEVDGRWDYALAAPLREAPAPPYRIKYAYWMGTPDNLNEAGAIWGANYDGGDCPLNANSATCYDHYYRVQALWNGPNDKLRTKIKRIEWHDDNGNEGRGYDILNRTDLGIGNVKDPENPMEWQIEYYANGDIKLYTSGTLKKELNDSSFLNEPYFGFYAGTDEYLGTEPHIAYFTVEPIE